MANCFTNGHHLPRTTTEWDMAMSWYLKNCDDKINPDKEVVPPLTVDQEWSATLRQLRRHNFSCTYPAMDEGPSYKAVTDPPFTTDTEKRVQFGNKFEHPLFERSYPHKAHDPRVTGIVPRCFAPPYKPLPGTDAQRVAFYQRYMRDKKAWEATGQVPNYHYTEVKPAETAETPVFH